MDYIKWSQEYVEQAHKLLSVIRLRNIYYECMLTAKHLAERAGVMLDAA